MKHPAERSSDAEQLQEEAVRKHARLSMSGAGSMLSGASLSNNRDGRLLGADVNSAGHLSPFALQLGTPRAIIEPQPRAELPKTPVRTVSTNELAPPPIWLSLDAPDGAWRHCGVACMIPGRRVLDGRGGRTPRDDEDIPTADTQPSFSVLSWSLLECAAVAQRWLKPRSLVTFQYRILLQPVHVDVGENGTLVPNWYQTSGDPKTLAEVQADVKGKYAASAPRFVDTVHVFKKKWTLAKNVPELCEVLEQYRKTGFTSDLNDAPRAEKWKQYRSYRIQVPALSELATIALGQGLGG